jgi:predicted ATPase
LYSSFRIQGFRGIADLQVDELPRLNVVAGRNGSGKTSLLEGLFLVAAGRSPHLALVVNGIRGLDVGALVNSPNATAPWDSLFRNLDRKGSVQFGATFGAKRYAINIKELRSAAELRGIQGYLATDRGPSGSNGPTGPTGASGVSTTTSDPIQALDWQFREGSASFSHHYLVQDAQGVRVRPAPPTPLATAFYMGSRLGNLTDEIGQFGEIVVNGRDEEVVAILRLLQPDIVRLTTVVDGTQPQVYAELKGLQRLLPLKLMGEGLVRLFTIAVYLVQSENGVLLIDEIENGIHYTVRRALWAAIASSARRLNVQVFATTHSLEMIESSLQAEPEAADFGLHRLERTDSGLVRVVSMDVHKLSAALASGFEVR